MVVFIIVFTLIILLGILTAVSGSSGSVATFDETSNIKRYDNVSMEDESNNDLYNNIL